MWGKYKLCLLVFSAIAWRPASGACTAGTLDGGGTATTRDRLHCFAEEKYAELAEWLVLETAKVYEKASAGARQLHNVDLSSQLAEMAAYVQRAAQLDRKRGADKHTEIYALSEKCHEFEQKFTERTADADSAAAQMEQLLNSNGVEALNIEFASRFIRLADVVEAKVTEYVGQMTARQRSEDAKLLSWYNRLKNEPDADKRSELIVDFLDVFNE